MAHSATSTATSDMTSYYTTHDESGKSFEHKSLAEVIKQEPQPGTTSAVYTTNISLAGYNQLSSTQPSMVRISNSYNMQPVENAAYTVISSGSNGGSVGGIRSMNSGIRAQQNHLEPTIKYERYDEDSNSQLYTPVKYRSYDDEYSNSSDAPPKMTFPVKSTVKYVQQNQTNTKTKSKMHTTISTTSSVQRKRKPEKAGKGLRHFSMKVCEKVKEKGTTTYNEVADELVEEEMQISPVDSMNCDQKNIRRRVYDALNVLMAMQIISKDKKEIRWIGLPTNSVECTAMEKENEERRQRIQQKHQQLQELLLQMVSFKSLIERNKEAERQGIIPTPNSSIQLPFIIVNTHKSTKVHCSVANDKSEYIFRFADKFEMHDDAEVLKRMGLLYGLDKGQCSHEDIERAKKLVPPNFEKYIDAYGNGKGITGDSDDDVPSYMDLQAHEESSSQGFTTHDYDDNSNNGMQQQQAHHLLLDEDTEDFPSDVD